MKTRQEINQEVGGGSYGSGVGTIVLYTLVGTIVALIIQWVC